MIWAFFGAAVLLCCSAAQETTVAPVSLTVDDPEVIDILKSVCSPCSHALYSHGCQELDFLVFGVFASDESAELEAFLEAAQTFSGFDNFAHTTDAAIGARHKLSAPALVVFNEARCLCGTSYGSAVAGDQGGHHVQRGMGRAGDPVVYSRWNRRGAGT